MGLTSTQKEIYAYCERNEYISPDTLKDFEQRLEAEGNIRALSYALKKFVPGNCPACNAGGAFKWDFLGKLTHPACNRSWYVSPGTYMAKSIKDIFRTGFELGGGAASKEDKTTDGIFGFIFGFIIGVSFRAPFAAILVPIQAVVSLSQKKS